MNYYNPYFNFPYNTMASRGTGLFSRLLGGARSINWGNIITNIQRTLNVVNQAIPVIKQVNPMIKNAKTMFRVMSEFNKNDSETTVDEKKDVSITAVTKTPSDQAKTNSTESTIISQGPTFFL